MKNLVKISIFALALGFFASCAEETKTEETTTNYRKLLQKQLQLQLPTPAPTRMPLLCC
ncbi:MAG: hypothetical protein IPJ31_06965 [Bacteroidetes bacterium]|nr:hypothetical protein [Bacteroidota bacterium]